MTARVGIEEVGRADLMGDSPYISWAADASGFTVTPDAYREFVRAARLRPVVATQLRRLRQGADIVAVGACIRTAYRDAAVPEEVAEAISAAYQLLGGDSLELVVGREAADDPLVEFLTGPQEIFLHVRGSQALLAACKRCWASLYTDRALIYREVRDIDQLSVDLPVHIQPMTKLEHAADSGVNDGVDQAFAVLTGDAWSAGGGVEGRA